MRNSNLARLALRAALRLLWPWPAIKQTIWIVRSTKDTHSRNFGYIRALWNRSATGTTLLPRSRLDMGFDQAISTRPESAPSLDRLKRRFLYQKRIALATALAMFSASVCAIANGSWLGVATIVSSGPLLFMACLSAHFRLWQLRTRRLSPSERGGLQDFLRETPRWPLRVLDPELSESPGGRP